MNSIKREYHRTCTHPRLRKLRTNRHLPTHPTPASANPAHSRTKSALRRQVIDVDCPACACFGLVPDLAVLARADPCLARAPTAPDVAFPPHALRREACAGTEGKELRLRSSGRAHPGYVQGVIPRPERNGQRKRRKRRNTALAPAESCADYRDVA